jgi:two-component system, NarL family, sensor kinase
MTSESDALLQRNRELSILNHIAETLNGARDLQAALDDTLASVIDLLGLQTGWIFLADGRGKPYLAAYHAVPPALDYPGPPWVGGCTCNSLFKSGELRAAINIVTCSRLAEARGDRRGLEVHASAPLRSGARMLGILNVAAPGPATFQPDTLLLLSAVGAQLGTAIERVRLAEQAIALAALEERNRIAREIHDTLAQGLAAIALHLEAAQALAATRPDAAPAQIDRALALARDNMEEARRSVLDLRAAPLAGRNLAEALRALGQEFAADAGIPIQVLVDPRLGRLPSALETGLYRITQEALTNIRKHAGPAAATVTLRREAGGVRLTIDDTGAGFDPAAVAAGPTGGFGLTGMRERAHLLAGRLEISSAPSHGARVEVTAPIPRTAR